MSALTFALLLIIAALIITTCTLANRVAILRHERDSARRRHTLAVRPPAPTYREATAAELATWQSGGQR